MGPTEGGWEVNRYGYSMPKRLRILGIPFTVKQVHGLTTEAEHVVTSDWVHEGTVVSLLGSTHVDDQSIKIEVNVGPDIQRKTLLHESLHAMFALTAAGADLDDAAEERIVKRLAPVLLQFLRDNRSVYSYLTGRGIW